MLKKKRILAIIIIIALTICNIPKFQVSAKVEYLIDTIQISDASSEEDDGGLTLSSTKLKSEKDNEVKVELDGRLRHGENGYGINVVLELPGNYYNTNETEPSADTISVTADDIEMKYEVIKNLEVSDETSSSGEITRNYPKVKFNMPVDNDNMKKTYKIVIRWAENFYLNYIINTEKVVFENNIEDVKSIYYYNSPQDITYEQNFTDNLGNNLLIDSIYVEDNKIESSDNIEINDKSIKVSKGYIKSYYDNMIDSELSLKIKLKNDSGIITSFNFIISIDFRPLYKVTCYLNGDSGTTEYFSCDVLEGFKLEEYPPTPEKYNYEFVGWKEEGKEEFIDFNKYTVSDGNKKIIAVWTINNVNEKIEVCDRHEFEGNNYYKDKAVIRPKIDGWKIGKTQNDFGEFVEIEKTEENETIDLYLTDGNIISQESKYMLDGIIDINAPEIEAYHLEDKLNSDGNKYVYEGNAIIYVKVKDNDYSLGEELKGNKVSCTVNNNKIDCNYNEEKACFVLNLKIKAEKEYLISIEAEDRVGHKTTNNYTVTGKRYVMLMSNKLYNNNKLYDSEYKENQYINNKGYNNNFELILKPIPTNGILSGNWKYSFSIDEGEVKPIILKDDKLILSLNDLADGSHVIRVIANCDSDGNQYNFSYSINVDNKGPLISSEKYDKDYYFEKNENISIDYFDINGVDKIYLKLYKYNENSQTDDKYEEVKNFNFSKDLEKNPVSGTLILPKEYAEYYKNDGKYKITATATDGFGIESEEYVFCFNVDFTPPVLNSFIRTGIDKEYNNYDMDFVNSDVKIELNVTDNLSGVDKVLYSTEGYSNSSESAFEAEYINGKYVAEIKLKAKDVVDEKLYITLIDKKGNIKNYDKTISVKIDNQSSFITDTKLSNEKYTNQNIIFSSNISDGVGSGVKKIEWSKDDGKVYEDVTEYYGDNGEFKIVIDKNGYYKVKVTDMVNNISETNTIFVNNIDKEAPAIKNIEVETNDESPEWKSSEALFIVKANDKGTSGLKELYWLIKDSDNNEIEGFKGFYKFEDNYNKNEDADVSLKISNLVNLKDGKYKIEAYVIDNAGNYSQVKNTDLFVDHTPPVLKWNMDKGYIVNGVTWYGKSDLNNNLKIDLDITDENAGIDDKDIKIRINGELIMQKDYSIIGSEYKKTIQISPALWKNSNGKYEIKAEVTDRTLNNTRSVTTQFFADNTNPQISSFNMKISGNDGNADSNGIIVKDNSYGYYFKKPSTVYIYAEDNNVSSGIKSITYFLCEKGQNYDKAKSNAITKNVDGENKIAVRIPEEFKGQIYAIATDKVGNKSVTYVKPASIVIDNHKKDTDAITISRPASTHKDNTGLDLYNNNVPVRISIKDTTSGIREVKWRVESINDTSANYEGLLTINNDGQIIGESADVIASEENLKTHISKDILVSNNDNNIKLTVTMTDRAGNISTQADVFSIDKTIPMINVSYDNNMPDTDNREFFNTGRVATITVRERNFNPADVNVQITNTQGDIPTLSEWSVINGTGNGDDTIHSATLHYINDGDYTFKVSYSDNAGNQSINSFVEGSISADKFTIDRTNPVLNVNYDNNSAVNSNYYQNKRTATFTINEHNFDAGRFELNITENGNNVNRNITWTSSGDTHMASILLDNEAFYNIQANYTDMAGNAINGQYSTEFYVDKYIPEIVISGVEDRTPYTAKEVSFNISSSDTYFNNILMTLSLVKSDGSQSDIIRDNIQKSDDVGINISNISNGQQISVFNLVSDGIYKLSCAATDKAGRSVNKDILFSVNREGPTYFIEDKSTLSIKDKYLKSPQDIVFSEINVNELYSDTIKITVFRGNNNWDLTEGADYTIKKVESEDKWCEYQYIIKKENFVENGIYHVTIASKDRAENDAISERFSFIVDNQVPVCSVFDLKSNKVYVSDRRNVRFKLTDNIALDYVKVLLNDNEVLSLNGDELIKELGGENIISVVISSSDSKQDLVIKYADKAGNEGEISVNNFYVTKNMWIRFITNTPLAAGTAVAILLIITLTVAIIIKKQRLTRKNN